MGRHIALIAFLAASGVGLLAMPPRAHAVDYDCANFSNQAEAQGYLLAGDPYGLDGDGDGIACEALPCPCSHGSPYPPVAPPPPLEEPAVLRGYVACGLSRYARPARECPRHRKIGAFFESSREVAYAVCVVFPLGRRICADEQLAQAATLYVNKLTTNAIGRHKVIWYAAGQRLVRVLWRY
jgi:excalibur calcium-binding domain-containing protein